MTARLRAWLLGCLTAAHAFGAGCNMAYVVSAEAAWTAEKGTDAVRHRAVGGASGSYDLVTSADNGITTRLAADLALLGNDDGFTGRFNGEGQAGFAALDGPHRPFGRVGARGYVAPRPRERLAFVEVPSLALGYQYQSRDRGAWHVEVAPRASLIVAGDYRVGPNRADLGATPTLGASTLVAVNLGWAEVTYSRFLDGPLRHLLETSACIAGLPFRRRRGIESLDAAFGGFALCVEARQEVSTFERREWTSYLGIRLGVGLAGGGRPDKPATSGGG